jgi:hypothetical protein
MTPKESRMPIEAKRASLQPRWGGLPNGPLASLNTLN